MCGVIGIAGVDPASSRAWLSVGRDAMSHRGPDDFGEWWSEDGRVGLAHRRLSIMDLTASGHQPMIAASGSLAIVFNGEIYNFVEVRRRLEGIGYNFRSHTDTEVILAAYSHWGRLCLAELSGMFAFAIYDREEGRLFAARDRAGEKPFYYRHDGSTIRFASELKGLMADTSIPRLIHRDALDYYLAVGFVPGERCILRDVHKLPPAHALEFDLRSGQLKTWLYWQLPDVEAAAACQQVDESALLDELDSLLDDSVRRQLVADVPVGVLLSGGVDSSLVTAMAVRSSCRVKTFTIRFSGYPKEDETQCARLIARHFDTEHVELEGRSATADLLPRLAQQFDEPIVDSSMIPTHLVSELVRSHCLVALGGDGGDELFGGYSHYNRLLWLQEKFGRIPSWLRQKIALGATRLLPVGLKGRNWLQGFGVDLDRGLPLIASYFDSATRQRLMSSSQPWFSNAEGAVSASIPLSPDLLQRATRMDFANYLPEDILVKVDRASMLNSLEVRAPFLDYRLIEFAFSKVPSHLKATAWDRKILLKRLTARLLPSEFDRKRKQGFSVPLAQWLRDGQFRALFWDVLTDSQCLFDREVVDELLGGQDRGRNNAERLFALVVFELWRRHYGASL